MKSRDSNIHRLTHTANRDDNGAKDRKSLVRKFTDDYFDRFDSNHDNLMSMKDMENMLNHMYKKKNPKGLSKAKVHKLMTDIDNNNDGKVCKDEFYLFCKKTLI